MRTSRIEKGSSEVVRLKPSLQIAVELRVKLFVRLNDSVSAPSSCALRSR
jgi:hypothetical protein